MLQWEPWNILSFGAGTPSTALALMSCQNSLHGPPYPYPSVPVYDAVIFCDLHSEPSWVYTQADFVAAVCKKAGILFCRLDSGLYGDFTSCFGLARTASLPFWSKDADGKSGRMPRQCTYDYKIKVIEKYVRYSLFGYKPRQRTLSLDKHAHFMHMGIMWEERRRAKESKLALFTNQYPLVDMGWTRADCYAYNREVWGLETKASSCLFCPFHSNFFYQYLREHEPESYGRALHIDDVLDSRSAYPALRSKLFLSKSRKRLSELSAEECRDARTFLYCGSPVWDGF